MLVGAFGVVALLLAAIGVYGVVAYVVGQGTNEIGIRIALGAKSADIVKWTLKTGLTPALVGLTAGTAGALALSRWLGAQLYEVSPTDPVVFAGVGILQVDSDPNCCQIPTSAFTSPPPPDLTHALSNLPCCSSRDLLPVRLAAGGSPVENDSATRPARTRAGGRTGARREAPSHVLPLRAG